MFGANPMRGAIIRVLAQHPEGMTSGAIERELEASYQTVFRHLQALGETGIVSPAAQDVRHGRRTIYTIDRNAVNRAIDEYKDYVLPAVAPRHDDAERATDD